MRDHGGLTPRQLYDSLTQRLAHKLARDRAPLIAPEDVAQVTDLLDRRQDWPDPARLWLSLRADGTVIDASASVLSRLGLRSHDDLAQDFRARLRKLDGDKAFLSLPDATGQIILCRARRAAGARHWLIEEMGFPANPDLGDAIARLWGFSPSETAIALALLSGEQATEIAARTDRAIGTVRQGIKAVLAKMHAPTQAKAAVRLALVAADWQTHAARSDAPQPSRHVVPHSDATGSALHYCRFGAEQGQPVLLLHGALFGVMSSPAQVTAARLFGLDVIAPERPGYGMTALPDGADPVELAVARVRDTLRAAGVARALVVAHDVGTAYAFALARAAPDCVSAIICAPATPPMTGWAQTADMPPLHRVSAFVTQKAPALMEAIVKLGVDRATREGLRALPQMIFADSAHDRGVLQQPAAYPVLENLFLSVTDQQGAGFLQDMFVTNLNWSGWLRDIACPVRFLHGAKSLTVSRAALERTCTALSDARLTVVPDAGHTLPITHPELAFREALLLAAQPTGRTPSGDPRSA